MSPSGRQAPATRALNFPEAISLGQLVIQAPGRGLPQRYEQARGVVEVGAASSVRLCLSPRAALKHLGALNSLQPDDLTAIEFPALVTVAGPQTEHLRHLTGLRALRCGDNSRPQDSMLDNLTGLQELTELSLCGEGITDRALEIIGGFARLEVLALDETGISDAGLGMLSGLGSLKRLSVCYTDISDQGIRQLSHLKKLIVWSEGSATTTPVWSPGRLSAAIETPEELLGILDYKIDIEEHRDCCRQFMQAVCPLLLGMLPDVAKEGWQQAEALPDEPAIMQSTLESRLVEAEREGDESRVSAINALMEMLEFDSRASCSTCLDSFIDRARKAGDFDGPITAIGRQLFSCYLDEC